MPNGKVGVGVITMQNRQIKSELLNLISGPTAFYVHVDHERNGPGYGRNECIKNLYDSDCDHIFLFDDDTFPVIKGWQDYFIEWATRNHIESFAYPNRAKFGEPVAKEGDVEYWHWCTTPFQYLSRKMVDTVGYYNTAYDRYAYEDLAYLYRARVSGLCGYGIGDAAPEKVDTYIHSMDFLGGDNDFSVEANMSLKTKDDYAELNHGVFQQEVSSGILYYPYDQVQV